MKREQQARRQYIAENRAIVTGWTVTAMELHASHTVACNEFSSRAALADIAVIRLIETVT